MYNNDFFKKVGFGLSFCLYFSSSVAVANSQIQPKAISSLITDIDRTVAVGERGHVFVFDGSWSQVETPTSVNLTNVTMLNDRIGWAVGHDATIMKTDDGGKNWQVQSQSEKLAKPFLDVIFFDTEHGIAVGAYGLFYRTNDGGENWKEEFHLELLLPDDQQYLAELKDVDLEGYEIEKGSLLPHFNRILSLEDGRLLLVGELGTVAVSDDLGKSFSTVNLPYEGSMFNAIETSNYIYVVGLRGHVFKSDKRLSNWTQIPLPSDSTIHGILSTKSGLVLVGNSGVVYSIDSKDKVKLLNKYNGVNLLSVSKVKSSLWLAGTHGLTPLK